MERSLGGVLRFGNPGRLIQERAKVGGIRLIATLSLSSLLLGGTLSYASTRPNTPVEHCQIWGGRFLIVGLALIGAGMPLFR